MRKLIIFFLAVSLFAACNNDKGKVNRDDRRSDRETDDYRNKDDDNKDNKDSDSRDKWTAGDESTFNRECEKTLKGKDLTDDQMNSICSCLLGKFQDKYSSYDELERKSTEEEGKAAGEACMAGITKTSDDDNSGSWSRSDKQQWMDVCDQSVGSKMGKDKKTAYCGCVLEQLEKRYSNYDVMNRTGTEQEGLDLGKECLRKMGLQ